MGSDAEEVYSKEELQFRAKVRDLLFSACGKKIDSTFAKLDKDGSGVLDLDEFKDVVRRTMKIRPADMSDRELKEFYSMFESEEEEGMDIGDLKQFILKEKEESESVEMAASV